MDDGLPGGLGLRFGAEGQVGLVGVVSAETAVLGEEEDGGPEIRIGLGHPALDVELDLVLAPRLDADDKG